MRGERRVLGQLELELELEQKQQQQQGAATAPVKCRQTNTSVGQQQQQQQPAPLGGWRAGGQQEALLPASQSACVELSRLRVGRGAGFAAGAASLGGAGEKVGRARDLELGSSGWPAYELASEEQRPRRRKSGAGGNLWSQQKALGSLCLRAQLVGRRTMEALALFVALNLLIYYWPMEEPQIEAKISAPRPRPRLVGALASNSLLDRSESLFAGQFHAPESMAWKADRSAFYTGVEGGFILLVEPYEERWTLVARLNARGSVQDESALASFKFGAEDGTATTKAGGREDGGEARIGASSKVAPFCERDIELYGPRAEFEPRLVSLSRCSRPLGIRLSPDDSRLYVSDPLSGLYLLELAAPSAHAKPSVRKLLDFGHLQLEDGRPAGQEAKVLFGDDIAVDWGAGSRGSDLIYLTDCSRRWSLRYLFRLMLENDDSGRLLAFDVGARQLRPFGPVTPVLLPGGQLDERNLSFPNGLELTANRSALLISDLNNRRILKHHLMGEKAGKTEHLLWAAGYSDNIRRGLDQPNGQPTYWSACGCGVSDGKFEITEFFNNFPKLRKLFLKSLHFIGSSIERLGKLLNSVVLQDAGLITKAVWLKVDPYCMQSLVFQFDEQGQVLRSLHAPNFASNFKLLSEAHEVQSLRGENSSTLYLGSVYYSYLGRVSLEPLEARGR